MSSPGENEEANVSTSPPSGRGGAQQPQSPQVSLFDMIKNSATYLRQKIQYVAKQNKFSHQDFQHDEEIDHCIKVLERLSSQTKTLNRHLNDFSNKERDMNMAEHRHQERLEKLATQFDPIQFEELLLPISETLTKRVEYGAEYVEAYANELARPVDTFYKANIKQTRTKKYECNMSSIIRENQRKNYNSKLESENNKEPEKRNDAELQQAEKKKDEAENYYGLMSGELLMLVESLEFKQRLEIPAQILSSLEARETYYKNCLDATSDLKRRLTEIVKGLQSPDFKPQYRPPPELGQSKGEESDENYSDEEDDDDDDDEDKNRKLPYTTSPTSDR